MTTSLQYQGELVNRQLGGTDGESWTTGIDEAGACHKARRGEGGEEGQSLGANDPMIQNDWHCQVKETITYSEFTNCQHRLLVIYLNSKVNTKIQPVNVNIFVSVHVTEKV